MKSKNIFSAHEITTNDSHCPACDALLWFQVTKEIAWPVKNMGEWKENSQGRLSGLVIKKDGKYVPIPCCPLCGTPEGRKYSIRSRDLIL